MVKRYTFLLLFLLPACHALRAQTAIDALEYFIDTDPGAGLATPVSITSGPLVNKTFTVPTASLSPGFHRLYIRGRFTDGRWGLTEERTFYLTQPVANPTPDITALEYFIDTDPGAGNGTPVATTPGTTTNKIFTVPTASLSAGFHRLYLRGRFANGRWGLTEERTFYLSPTANYGLPQNIVSAEVFFDTDPGAGQGIPVALGAPGQAVNTTVHFTVPALSLGQHLMYLRAKFADGRWGLVDLDTVTVLTGVTCFADTDGDGYGDAGNTQVFGLACEGSYIADSTDCNDHLAAVHPGAPEICNGLDDDCDGLGDLDDPGVVVDGLAKAAVKLLLQGPYVSNVQLMHDSLRVKGLIPLAEPYTGLTNFTHAGGGGGEQTTPAVLAISGPNAIVDWVFLELRSAANPILVLATRSALLQRDGDVVDVDGVSPVTFGIAANQSYYLAIRHRNHLGVQLGQAVFYPECEIVRTDFSTLPPEGFYAFNGLNPAERLVGGKYLPWAGNGRIDFQLKYNGSNNDRTAILSVVGLSTPNAAVPGYLPADYNMDGLVKYNGSNNDRNVLLGNVGISTPSAIVHDQVAR